MGVAPVRSKLRSASVSYDPIRATSLSSLGKHTVLLLYKNGCPYCEAFFIYWNAVVSICSKFENANFVSIEKEELLNAMQAGESFGGNVKSYPTLRVVLHTTGKKLKLVSQWDMDQEITDGPALTDRSRNGFSHYGIMDRDAFEREMVGSADPEVSGVSVQKLGLLLAFVRESIAAS